MKPVIAVVEGPTEQAFVQQVLGPWLWDASQVTMSASAAGKPGKKGGNQYGKAKRDFLKHLNNPYFARVTTFFDFYGMGHDWPGRADAATAPQARKPCIVEAALREDIRAALGDEATARFVPYVQMHEFEALLFAKPAAIAEVMLDESAKAALAEIRDAFVTPEEINDSPQTAPSKRIESLFAKYQKPVHGVIAAKRITIEVMLRECPHFRGWVETLASLGA